MTTQTPQQNRPTHIAYHVRDVGEQSYWDRVGVAWQHRDGKGFNVELSCMPIDGKLTLRVPSDPKLETAVPEQQSAA